MPRAVPLCVIQPSGVVAHRRFLRDTLALTGAVLTALSCGGGDSLTLPVEGLPTAIVSVSGDNQTGTAGRPVADSLVVHVTDSRNRDVQDQKVVFQAVAGGTGALLIPDTATTNINGLAVSRWQLGRIAGPQRVEVRVIATGAAGQLRTSFSATAVADLPDTVLALRGNGQSGVVGTLLSDSLVVLVTDQYGNPIAGQAVDWSVPGGQGSVSAASTPTGADGRAAVRRTLGPSAGTQSASATATGVPGSPVVFTSTATSGNATSLVKLFGDAQTAPAGFQVTDSVVVRVQDVNGNGVPGRSVNWVVTDGGSVNPLTSTTDSLGRAFAFWTLKPTAGANQLTAAASGLAQVQFSATGTSAQPTTLVALSSTTLNGTVGQAITPIPSVKVTDQNNNPVQGVTVTFDVTQGGGGVSDGSGSGASASVATNASGIASLASWTLGTVAGANAITASATDAGGAPLGNSPITFSATAAAGGATALVIVTPPPAGAQSGVTLGQQPVVALRDAFGNAVARSGVLVTASVPGGGVLLRGTLTASTNSGGSASFSGLNLFGPVGSYPIAFASSGLTPDTSAAIALSAGPAALLGITTQPSPSAQSGVPFAVQPVLQVRDSSGNAVAANGVLITATLASGTGTLGGASATTGPTGAATFAGLAITGSAGTRTLSFGATGLGSVVSATVTLGAGSPTQLALLTQPSTTAQSGSVLARQPVVELRDASGNTVPLANVVVAATITGHPSGVVLGGADTVVTGSAGSAAFSGLTLSGPAGNYSLTVNVVSGAGGVAPVTSGTIALSAGSGTALTLEVPPPASAQSGVTFFPAPVLQLRDGSGNGVSQAGVAVFATITSGAGGVVGGTDTVLTNASGVATFSALNIAGPVGSYILSFGGSGLTGVTSGAIALTAGPAAALALTTQPAAVAQSGVVLTQQPVVRLEDASGNPVAQAGTVVTASIATGGGSLGGTLTATTDPQGSAAFNGLALSGTVGSRTLRFAATGLLPDTSGVIGLTAGPAAAMVLNAGNGQTATAGSPVPINPQVKVTDASGNPVAGVDVSFTVTSGGGSAAAVQQTDLAGLAAVTWTLGTTAGANGLDATAQLFGGPASVSFTATGTAGSAGQLAIITQPSATAQSGVAFGQQPVIQLQDQNGNNVSTSGVAITAQSSGALSGNTTVATVNGVATFSNLALTGLAGSYQLTFTGTNLTGVSSSPIGLSAGAASRLVVVSQPSSPTPSGAPFALQPQVQVQDAAGNAVAGSGRSVTAAINSGPGGTLGSSGRTVTTDGAGLASYTTLAITGPVGNYTLLFSSVGLAADTSTTLAITAGGASQMTAASSTSQSATVGTAVAAPPTVLVRDAQNNPIAGVAVTFAITGGGGSLNGASTVTDGQGLAAVAGWTLGPVAGANAVTASASGLPNVGFSATGLAGSATTIALTAGDNQSATVGTAVAVAPAVRVSDANGNGVAGVAVTFAVSGGGGSVTGASVSTNASGIATVGSWTLGTVAGSNALTATASGLSGSPVGFSATGTAAAAATIAVNAGDAQTATAGTAVAVAPSVLVTDGFGNPRSGVAVTFAVAGGGGSLTGAATTTNASGIATVGSWTLGPAAGANTLTATSAGLSGSPVTFSATGTTGQATTIALNAGNGQSAVAGNAVPIAPSVKITDAGNNPVSGVAVTFAVTGGGGSVLPVGSVLTNASGIAAVTSWTLGTTAGSNTLTATATGLTGSPVTFSATGTAGPAATIVLNGGNGQSATVNTAVATAPSVKVTDANGNVVSGVSVTFAVTGGGGSVTGGSATTNASGIATVGSWTLGTTAGGNALSATSGTLSGSPVNFAATGVAGAATTIAVSAGNGQSAAVGTAVAIPPAVLVTDAFGNPKAGVAVTFLVTGGGGSLTGGSSSSNASGIAVVGSWTLGALAGSNTLTASAAGLAGSPVSFTATGTVGAATQLAVSVAPSATAQSGIALGTQPAIQLQDAGGNPVAQAGVTVTAVLFSGTRTLTNATAVSNGSGLASFSGLTISGLAGTDSLSFTATGLTGTGRSGVVVSAGTATKLAMNRQPSTTAASGTAFATQPRVQLQDSVGNSASVSGVVITASIASGPVGATLANATTTTGSTGLATFSGLSISGPVGSYTLQFDATGLTGIASGSITLGAGVANHLTITTQPLASVASGVAFSPPPVLQLRDAAGNPVPASGVAVTATVASGPGATLTNAIAISDAAGAATFSGITLTGTAGTYTLGFAGAGLTSVTSGNIDLSAGGGSKLGIQTQPSSSAANGAVFVTQPTIQLQDGSGNDVKTAGVTVTASIASGGGVLGGTVSQLTNGSGKAVFTNLSVTGTVGARTLLFAASGFTGVTSNSITLTPGAATQLALTTAPSSAAQSGIAFPTQPVVQLRDQSGNDVSSAGVTVTASIASGTGALIGSTAVATNGSGQSSYSGLGLSGAAGNFTLRFSGTSLTSTTTGTITLGAGAPSTIIVSAGNGQTATVGTAVATAPAVLVSDASGNPVANVAVTFGVTAGGGNVSVTNALTNGSGIAGAGSWTLGTTAGGNTLTATSAGLTGSPVTFSATATAASASQLVMVTQPSATVASGVTFPQQPAVRLADPFGNTVAQANVPVQVSVQSGSAALAGTTTVNTASNGIATFSGLSLAGPVGSNTLGFSSGGLTGTTSAGITLSAGASATSVTSILPATTVVGESYTVAVSVTGAGGTPTGSVLVSEGSATCSVMLSGGTGSCSLASSVPGSRTIAASYGGDANFQASAGGSSHTVNAAATTTVITADTPDPSNTGAAIAVSVAVAPVAPGAGTPTGSVTVSDGGLGSCTVTLSGGAGSCNLTSIALGGITLTATYAGDGSFSGSSDTEPHTVTLIGSTTSITNLSPASSVAGQPVTVSVSVSSLLGTPTGSVTVSDGVTSCVAALAGGSGSCNVAFPTAGARTITASYGGDATHGGSSSAGSAFTVNKASTVTTITGSSPDPSVVGAPYSVNFTVAVSAPGAGTPSGNVTVSDGAGGSCTVAAGAGSCQVTSTTAGARTLVATYAGDSNLNGSGSAGVSHQVDPFGAATQLAFTVQPSTTLAGDQISPPVEVSVLDAFGNLVTSASNAITLVISNDGSGGGATLGGTLTVNASGGVASFGDLTIDLAGTSFRLTATAASLTDAESIDFDIQ